jgi:hypothetical protein
MHDGPLIIKLGNNSASYFNYLTYYIHVIPLFVDMTLQQDMPLITDPDDGVELGLTRNQPICPLSGCSAGFRLHRGHLPTAKSHPQPQ